MAYGCDLLGGARRSLFTYTYLQVLHMEVTMIKNNLLFKTGSTSHLYAIVITPKEESWGCVYARIFGQ